MTNLIHKAFVRESNRIEDIVREPHPWEVAVFSEFLIGEAVTVHQLEHIVSAFQPGARLRKRRFMDVTVGDHLPPGGGPHIVEALEEILNHVNSNDWSPFRTHCEYESLHPFEDGNGRSGRALWAWQMIHTDTPPGLDLGFLHAFYYQTLSAQRAGGTDVQG